MRTTNVVVATTRRPRRPPTLILIIFRRIDLPNVCWDEVRESNRSIWANIRNHFRVTFNKNICAVFVGLSVVFVYIQHETHAESKGSFHFFFFNDENVPFVRLWGCVSRPSEERPSNCWVVVVTGFRVVRARALLPHCCTARTKRKLSLTSNSNSHTHISSLSL